MTSYSPTVRRRRLSRELRTLRRAAQMDAVEVARRLSWPPSRLSRIENAEWRRPNVRDVRELLDIYGVTDDDRREALFSLARQSLLKGWWADFSFRGTLPEFESEASIIRTYESLAIPGLLQTPEYAAAFVRAAVTRRSSASDDAQIERRVAARMARQRILERVELYVVIDEAALHRRVGGSEVMRAQLLHLAEIARPNISIRVLPNAVGAHAAMAGPFVLLDFPIDPSVVYLETATDSLLLEQEHEVRAYAEIYDRVQSLALPVGDSLLLIERLAGGLDEGG